MIETASKFVHIVALSKCNEGVSDSELDNPGFSAMANSELKKESPPVTDPNTNPQLEDNTFVSCQSACAMNYK